MPSSNAHPAASSDPLVPGDARDALLRVHDRDEAFALLLRALLGRTESAAIFTIKRGFIRGRLALDHRGFDRERVREIEFDLDGAPSLRDAIAAGAPRVEQMSAEPVLRALLADVFGSPPQTALLLPIAIGERVVAAAVACSGGELAVAQLMEIVPLATATGDALARAIAAAKQAGRQPRASEWPEPALPDDVPGLEAACNRLRSEHQYEALATALEALLERDSELTPDRRLALYGELAQIEVGQLGHVDRAIEIWHQALAFAPDHVTALAELESLLASRDRWPECAEVLQRRAALSSGSDAVEALLRAADIFASRLADEPTALTVYAQVRAHEPSNPIACERLAEAYRRDERWAELAEVLLERAQQLDDVHDRADLLTQVATLYERDLGDLGAAFLVLDTAVHADPEGDDLARELVRVGTAIERWDALCDTWEARAAAAEDPERAAELWLEVARWHADRRGDHEAAARCAERAAETDSASAAALGVLADVHRASGNHAALIAVLEQRAAAEATPDARAEHWLAVADVYETALADPPRAIAAYQRALADDPSCLLALVSLERLYTAHEMWEQLADVLAAMTELRTDPDERDEWLRLMRARAAVWSERLLEPAQAIAIYDQIIEVAPEDAESLAELESLHEQSGHAEAYLDVLERKLDRAETDGERIRLYERLASVWEKELERPDRAAICLEKLTALDIDNRERYRSLVRLYRRTGDWNALLDTYRTYVELLEEPTARVDIFCAMAEVCELEQSDLEAAAGNYERALAVDRDEPRALDALGRLRAESAPAMAVSYLERLLEATVDAPLRADLCLRLGRLAYERLGDATAAERRLREAVEAQPALVEAFVLLGELYTARRDGPRAAEALSHAGAAGDDPVAAAGHHREAARIALSLGDRAMARRELSSAVARDPDALDAAASLAERMADDEDWGELRRLLDGLLPAVQAAGWSAERRVAMRILAARAAIADGDSQAALGHYDAALALAPGEVDVLAPRADLLFERRDWAGAATAYRALLVHGASSEPARARICYRLGRAHQGLGEVAKAVDMLRRCVSIDPSHRDALGALAELAQEQRDWPAAVQARRELAAVVEPAERVRLLEQVGDLYREKLASPPKALAAYREALEHDPRDHRLLQRALELHTELEQWPQALAVIERFLALEPDPVRQASYHRAAGAICRAKANDPQGAVAQFEAALDCYFGGDGPPPAEVMARALEAFREIDELLTSGKDWKEQEKAYRRMIKRVGNTDQALAVALWDGLGEICRTRLRHYRSALNAYAVAHQLAPRSERIVILSELAVVAGPEARSESIAALGEVLRGAPTQPEPYRALVRICREAGDLDAAWCAASVLVYLGAADATERALFEEYRPRKVAHARQRVTHELWNALRDPAEDRYIGSIFAAIQELAAQTTAQPHKSFGLKRKDKLDLSAEERFEPRLIRYVSDALGVPRPEVFVQADRPGELLLANCGDRRQLLPALVIREDFARRPERDAVYLAVRQLAFLRAERYLKIAMPTTAEQKSALMAAITLCQPQFPVPPELAERTGKLVAELRERLPPVVKEQLGEVVKSLLARAPQLNVGAWSHGTVASAQRVALLLCGDLATAARLVEEEAPVPGGPRPRDAVERLLAFSVSDPYLSARRQLGLAIESPRG